MTSPSPSYPQPSDTVLVGWINADKTHVGAIKRSTVSALAHSDGQTPVYDSSIDSWSSIYNYGVLAHNGFHGVLVAEFDTVEERRQWIRDNAAAWLS